MRIVGSGAAPRSKAGNSVAENSVAAVPHARAPLASTPSLSSSANMKAEGKRLREVVSRESQAAWRAPSNRPDPIAILRASDSTRLPNLVPIRYGRMLASPFTFYRGSAGVMAADLAVTPASGVRVQSCGDAHLLNFGGFATPERRLVFDINDLDETLPAPWEWDVKRLVTSFVLAARSNGLSDSCRNAGNVDLTLSTSRRNVAITREVKT